MTRICTPASALGVAALCSALMASPAGAVSFTLGAETITTTTSPTGSSASVSTMQPSLALTPLIRTSGVFNQLGEVKFFAGSDYAIPGDYHIADGSVLSISQNPSLYSLLGTTYGGDGRFTFALPDLRGRAVVGSVAGGARMGWRSGWPDVSLNESHLPEHSHTTADGLTTETAGGGQAFDHSQPTIALSYEAVVSGLYPSRGGSSSNAPEQTMGFVTIDAALDQGAGFDPASIVASGQLLSIADNTALFSLYGTLYGGDGRTTFALPDTGETLIVGAGSGAYLTPHAVGAEFGTQTATLTTAQLPGHSHDDEGTETGATGGGGGFSNVDPSLSMTYLIATQGIYPSSGSGAGSDAAFLGEIALFGGNFVPSGWMQAAGQLLPIAQYSALFSLMGTTYGGDGRFTFALPNLVGRTAIGAGNTTYLGLGSLRLGQILGEEFTTLSTAQMAQHDHEVIRAAPVPLPAAGWMLFAALGGLGGLAARRRR